MSVMTLSQPTVECVQGRGHGRGTLIFLPPPSLSVCGSSDGGADLSAVGTGQKFFAKGTGFGSGSLRSGWDMEQVREAQKEIEQQVECCLKVQATAALVAAPFIVVVAETVTWSSGGVTYLVPGVPCIWQSFVGDIMWLIIM